MMTEQWTKARIASDPSGAFEYIRELMQSRNAWHRKFDAKDREFRLLRRSGRLSANIEDRVSR